MQTLEITRSSPQDLESEQSIVQTPENKGLICQALRSMDITVQLSPDYEGTSQDDFSAPPPAPSHSAAASSSDKRGTANFHGPAIVAPLVMPDAPRSTASTLLEVPCMPSHPPKFHSTKVLIDPKIHQGAEKQVRWSCHSSAWKLTSGMSGSRLSNLDNNFDLQFLSNKLQKMGGRESLAIDHHPGSKKHLGLASVVFKQVYSAKACAEALQASAMMGKVVNCYLYPGAAWPRRCSRS